jgi:hypothetical protein
MSGDEQLQRNDALPAFLGMNSGTIVIPVIGGRRMTLNMGVDAAGRMMVVVLVAQMRVDERRRQRACLQGDRESEGEKASAHALILLEGLVVDRAVRAEFV